MDQNVCEIRQLTLAPYLYRLAIRLDRLVSSAVLSLLEQTKTINQLVFFLQVYYCILYFLSFGGRFSLFSSVLRNLFSYIENEPKKSVHMLMKEVTGVLYGTF